MQNVLLWNVDLRACSSHTSPPFRSTAPPKRSSPRGREASASVRHAATHHAAGRQTQGFLTQTSITPLPHQARASRVWHAKCSAMSCRFVCLLCTHANRLSDPLLHTSAPHCLSDQLLHPIVPHPGVEASVSTRHAATHHAAGRQTQAFLTFISITPLPYLLLHFLTYNSITPLQCHSTYTASIQGNPHAH